MSAEPDTQGWQVRLLDGWRLERDNDRVDGPRRAQRLVAYLALQGAKPRTVIAGDLWPESTEARALTSLRTVVVRVRRLAPGLLGTSRDPLMLARGTRVDIEEFADVADALSEQAPTEAARRLMGVGELLPGWYEDWVLFERERFRQLRMSALDRVASRLLEQGDLPLALAAAQCCARLEPLRETPHRILVRIHFAAGDRVEALRVYEDFRRRSIEEFGLAPDSAFDDLVRPLLQERRARSRGPGAHPSGLRPPGRHSPGQRPPGQRPPGQRPLGP